MVHRCWGLDEIVRSIAAHLVLDEARASAVSLASCSKSLEEPALTEVWRSLSSLVPLVKCFPPEVWEIKDGKLVSVATRLEGTGRRSNRRPLAFRESPGPQRVDSISTALRVKGPTPRSFLPGYADILNHAPAPSTLLSSLSSSSKSRVIELGHRRIISSLHIPIYLSFLIIDRHRRTSRGKSPVASDPSHSFHIVA